MAEKNKKVLEYLMNTQAPEEIIDTANSVQEILEAYEKNPKHVLLKISEEFRKEFGVT
jgi:hypothetical protein